MLWSNRFVPVCAQMNSQKTTDRSSLIDEPSSVVKNDLLTFFSTAGMSRSLDGGALVARFFKLLHVRVFLEVFVRTPLFERCSRHIAVFEYHRKRKEMPLLLSPSLSRCIDPARGVIFLECPRPTLSAPVRTVGCFAWQLKPKKKVPKRNGHVQQHKTTSTCKHPPDVRTGVTSMSPFKI